MRHPIRQGDVILLPVEAIPVDAKKEASRVVAEGEVTGHAHRLTTGDVWVDDARNMFIDAGARDTLTHEEHGPVEVVGKYSITIQREYDDEAEWRQVAD